MAYCDSKSAGLRPFGVRFPLRALALKCLRLVSLWAFFAPRCKRPQASTKPSTRCKRDVPEERPEQPACVSLRLACGAEQSVIASTRPPLAAGTRSTYGVADPQHVPLTITDKFRGG